RRSSALVTAGGPRPIAAGPTCRPSFSTRGSTRAGGWFQRGARATTPSPSSRTIDESRTPCRRGSVALARRARPHHVGTRAARRACVWWLVLRRSGGTRAPIRDCPAPVDHRGRELGHVRPPRAAVPRAIRARAPPRARGAVGVLL